MTAWRLIPSGPGYRYLDSSLVPSIFIAHGKRVWWNAYSILVPCGKISPRPIRLQNSAYHQEKIAMLHRATLHFTSRRWLHGSGWIARLSFSKRSSKLPHVLSCSSVCEVQAKAVSYIVASKLRIYLSLLASTRKSSCFWKLIADIWPSFLGTNQATRQA